MVRRSFTGSAAWASTRPAISTSPASSARGTTPRSKPIPPRVNDSGTSTAWATGWTRPAPTRPMRTSSTPRRTSSRWTGASPPGREQSLAGLTVDRFKYPRDNRVTEGHGPAHRLINGVRRIDGKLFLYCGGQGTGSLEIYKFGEGCVAAPCGYVGGATIWRPGAGKRWPEDAESFIWTDGNGDGVPDPAEFASVERKPRWGFMHLDAAAGIWQCSGDGTISHLPCEGIDPRGNPIYRRASELSYKYPPEFTGDRLRRLFYIPGDDVLIDRWFARHRGKRLQLADPL